MKKRWRRCARIRNAKPATDNDGTWVAHPGLVGVANEIFDRLMPGPNQIDKKLADFTATAGGSAGSAEGRRLRKRGCGRTSPSASAIWKRGCAAPAVFRCSI